LLEHHQTTEGHHGTEGDEKNLEESKTSQSQLSHPDMQKPVLTVEQKQ
jgi:hypothetical protein